MASRLKLQTMLENILESRNVYYQPPSSIQMSYPAIVYSINDIDNNFADNSVYRQEHSYEITLIDKNPDSKIIPKISKLPTCQFVRQFKTENLNHYIFILYY